MVTFVKGVGCSLENDVFLVGSPFFIFKGLFIFHFYFYKLNFIFMEIKMKNEDSLKNKIKRTKGKNIIFQ